MSSDPHVPAHPQPGAGLEGVIRLLTDRYGPFNRAPRLDPAHEVVFTILSQHTSDTNSGRAFERLMDRFGTLEAVARADTAEIEAAIRPGGLARVKAPRIKQVLNQVLRLNGSLDLSFLREMPLDAAKAWLRQLPGIGPKSAGVILSFSLGRPAMAVDTHVYRVCQRLGLIGPRVTPEKAHDILEAAVEPERVLDFHFSFINHGRQVCRAQRPLCGECVVADRCPSRERFTARERKSGPAPSSRGDGRKGARARVPKSVPSEGSAT